MAQNLGQYLIGLLSAYGVDTVFGIPGVHTAELYRGLEGAPIRHVTPRHEQGAGFMADGYARVSGKPGVCLVITGPGLANIATAMLQARADSIPMLVIAGANDPAPKPRGRLHEMPDQSALGRQLARLHFSIGAPADLATAMDQAFTLFATGRPGPVLIEIPLSAMTLPAEGAPAPAPRSATPPRPLKDDLERAAAMIGAAERAVMVIGGGARRAAPRALALATRLDIPVVATINARSAVPGDHPLAVPASPTLEPVRALLDDADLLLAIGTELGPTDYDMYGTGSPMGPGKVIRIDIDPDQTEPLIAADLILRGDAGEVIAQIEPLVEGIGSPAVGGRDRALAVHAAARQALSDDYRALVRVLEILRDALPDAMLVGDSTQLVYAGNMVFAPGDRGEWFNSAVGFGTLGYGLPAAIGAKLATPHRPAIAIIGDGGIQFTLGELGTIGDEGAPVIVLVWNNSGYGEIKSYMVETGVAPRGVDITPPDFERVAEAYGLGHVRIPAGDLGARLAGEIAAAARQPRGTVVEIIAG